MDQVSSPDLKKLATINDSQLSTQKESVQVQDRRIKLYEDYQDKMKVVNSLVTEEKDLLGALNLLHPELHDALTSYIKKL